MNKVKRVTKYYMAKDFEGMLFAGTEVKLLSIKDDKATVGVADFDSNQILMFNVYLDYLTRVTYQVIDEINLDTLQGLGLLNVVNVLQ